MFLCGDVMTGRGIDQVLPYPVPPVLYEPYVHDAREYVDLAEAVNGRIPRPVDFAYIWGDALEELQHAGTDVRIVNLETSITSSEEAWPDKGINYRMNPRNVASITSAGIGCCSLANNHVLDWGYTGLIETLRTLVPQVFRIPGRASMWLKPQLPPSSMWQNKGRVLVFGFGSTTSGIPWEWGAAENWLARA